MSNPLLDFSGLPRFSEIGTEHVAPAIDELLAAARAAAEAAQGAPATWE
jgi:oligopeptidase A